MIEHKAVRGLPWAVLTYAGSRTTSLVTMVVLARLLAPADFGLLALASLTVALSAFLSSLGLGGALVVRQDIDKHAQGTVLTLMLLTGALFAAGLAAASPLVADLFGEPELAEILAVFAAIILFSGGINPFYEAVMQRELEFRGRFLAQIIQSIVNALVAISLAALGAGVWSLVAGQIAATAIYGVALVWLAPYRVRPRFDARVASDVLRTSRGFLVQWGAGFVSQNADYVVVGRALGARALGYYSMAYRVSEVPYWTIVDSVARVTFPGFARMHSRREDVTHAYVAALRLVAFVACPVGVLLSATAEPFTSAVFGDKWLPMVGPLSVLGIWTSVRAVEATAGWLLNSVGHANLLAVLSALFLIPLVTSLVLAAQLGGITTVSWVMLANAALSTGVVGYYVERRVGVSVARQGRALWPIAFACAGAWLAARGAGVLLDNAPALTAFAGSLGAGVAAYLGLVVLVDRRLLGQTLEQVRRVRSGAPAGAGSG